MAAIILFFLFGLVFAAIGFWIWCLIDILTGEFHEGNNKIIWVLVIILLPVIGMILYPIFRNNQRMLEN